MIALLIAGFGLITLNLKREQSVNDAESLVLSILSPVHGFITGITRGLENIWTGYIDLVDVHKENTKLREEVRKLQGMANTEVELKHQNRRLLQLLGYREKTHYDLVLAEVIGFDSSNWSRAIFINRGRNDGIRQDMPVISPEGVVGRVIEAARSSAKVLLITDPRSAIDSLIQRTRDNGVVVGENVSHVKMKYLSLEASVRVGDRVVSSGLGGVFPKGLVVGRIQRVIRPKFGLFQEAQIVPSADLSRLEEVFVMVKGG